jgi:ribosomal protein S18 acetylase RimI-like enzyme
MGEKMNMKIRQATSKDIPQIAELLQQYDIYENKLDKRHKVDSIKEAINITKTIMKAKNSIHFVLDNNGKLEGVISGEDRITVIGKNAIFHDIFISKELRGQGYGKKLLNTLIKYFKKRGCKQIKSFVYINNKKALKFYENLDFKYEEGYNITKKI